MNTNVIYDKWKHTHDLMNEPIYKLMGMQQKIDYNFNGSHSAQKDSHLWYIYTRYYSVIDGII